MGHWLCGSMIGHMPSLLALAPNLSGGNVTSHGSQLPTLGGGEWGLVLAHGLAGGGG